MSNRCSTFELSGVVEVLHGRYSGRAFAPHWHEEHAIGVIDEGAEQFEYRGAIHRATTGQIVLMDAGEVHTGEAADDRGFGFRMLYVPESALREVAGDESSASTLHFRDAVVTNPDVRDMLLLAHQAIETSASRLEGEIRMVEAFAGVLELSGTWKPLGPATPVPRSIKLATDFLNDNLASDVSLTELSALTGLSRFHLSRSFKTCIGLAPHAYQMQQRVMRAKRLLRKEPPRDVALACGFYDQSHLNRAFRLFAGTTPGRYAQQFHPNVSV